ncbi:MAG: PKD domain-containing protein [Nanoarchaeota archaeon]|nr:PKD domain-containing protein [Nanoarchaeota archaeon]
MKKRGILISSMIIVLIFSLAFANAGFKYYGHNIEKKYRAGEVITGYVNISLENENADSILASNLEGNISILEFLNRNDLAEGLHYTCNIGGCERGYTSKNEINSINLNKESIVGIKIVGSNIDEIKLFKFGAESGLSASCESPLEIDILEDGANIISSRSYNDVSCSSNNYGCFDNQLVEHSKILIEDQEICQTIDMKYAPAFRIGAKIANSTNGNGRLRMTMYNSEGASVSCVLPENSQPDQELDCIVPSIPANGNYSVCIESLDYSASGKPQYRIKSEKSGNVCGSSGRDFEIFARALQYGSSPMEVNNSLMDELYSIDLEEEILDYLKEKYELNDDGSVVCEPLCIVPIKFRGPLQTVKIGSVRLLYSDGGLTVDDEDYNKFYELGTTDVKINSRPLKLDMSEADFVIPIETKNKSEFKLYLNNQQVFRENISVEESFDFGISPRFILIGINTKLEAKSMYNITSSKWDYGDGTVEEVEGVISRHTFTESGDYNIKVELKRKDGVSAIKTFEMIVGNPKEASNRTIKNYKSRLNNITLSLDKFSPGVKNSLMELLEIENLKMELASLEKRFANSSSDADYTEVVEGLLALDIPLAIATSKEGKLPLAVGFEGIDASYIEEVSKEEVEEDELAEKIIEWMNSNYRLEGEFNIISRFNEGKKEEVLSSFILKIEPISDFADNKYLFIGYPFESITFKQDYGQKEVGEGEGAYIPLKVGSEEIEFHIDEGIEIYDLGIYVSPSVQSFTFESSDDEKPTCLPDDEDCQEAFPLINFLIGIGIVILASFIGYIVLQEWYKRNYERHLFKSGHDLYNLINFIYNSRASGLGDNEIKKKLKIAGWEGEKINYAFKKIDGKRTGMWEIPLFKGMENRKVKEEIAKRQGGEVNAKFIKHPRF